MSKLYEVDEVFRNVMGQDETTRESRVRTHMLGFNPTLNASDIRIFIPTDESEFSLYEHTLRHGYVMAMILMLLL